MLKEKTKSDPLFRELFPEKLTKGDKRKIEILLRCIEHISSQGILNLSFNQLGKELGIGRAHLFYYFESPEELLREVFVAITSVAQRLTLSLVAKENTRDQQLRAILKGAFEWAKKYPEQARTMSYLLFQCYHDQKAFELYRNVRQSGLKRIEFLFESLGQDKKTASLHAHLIQDVITGALTSHFSSGIKSLSTAEKHCLKLLESFIEATSRPKE